MLCLREMTLDTLTQCETLAVVLTSFDERDEKLIVNHSDAKKEMDLVEASIL
jgi:hypothetical protein